MEIYETINQIDGLSDAECYELIYNWLKTNKEMIAASPQVVGETVSIEDRVFVIDNMSSPESSTIYEKMAIFIEVSDGMFETFCYNTVATRYGDVPLLAVARCAKHKNAELCTHDVCYPELEKSKCKILPHLFHYKLWRE